MTVLSPGPTRTDLVRNVVVALLAIAQVVVTAMAGDAVGAVAREYPSPLLAAGWAFAVWVPIYVGFLGYAVFQALPGQRARYVHRATGWWMAASAVFNIGFVLSFGAGWLPLAQLMLIGLLASNFHRLALAKELMSRGAPEQEVFRVVNMPFSQRKEFLATARRADSRELARRIARIAEADLAIKTSLGGGGERGSRLQLEMLVCELTA